MKATKNKKSRHSKNRPLAICLGGVRHGDILPANADSAMSPRGYSYELLRHADGSIISAYIASGTAPADAVVALGELFAGDSGAELVQKLIRRLT